MTVIQLMSRLSCFKDSQEVEFLCPDGYTDGILKIEENDDGTITMLGTVYFNQKVRKKIGIRPFKNTEEQEQVYNEVRAEIEKELNNV